MTEAKSEIGELNFRHKILIINMGPTSDAPSYQIASSLFGRESTSIEDFSQMMLARINSPKKNDDEISGSLRQTMESTLNDLPSVDDVSAVIVTGSAFSASLLKRDVTRLGGKGEGKAVFMPRWQKELADFIKEVSRQEKPFLGICFGAEMMAEALGGYVRKFGYGEPKPFPKEVGYTEVFITSEERDLLLEGLPKRFVAIANHDREIIKIPENGRVLAQNDFGVQVFRVGRMWGVQFHPEKTALQAEKLLAKKENSGKLNPEQQAVLAKEFDPGVGSRILSNFLKISGQGAN